MKKFRFSGSDSKSLIPTKNKLDIPSFNLSEKINMLQFSKDLHKITSKPSPKGIIGKILSDYKLNLDNSRIDKIEELVERYRRVNQSITHMSHELYIQPKVLAKLIDGFDTEADRLAEIQFEEHEEYLQKIKDEAMDRKLNLLQKKHIADKGKWEVEEAKHRARLVELRAEIAEKIKNELTFVDINMKQVQFMNDMVKDAKNVDDLISAEAKWELMKEEAGIKKQVGRQEKYKADEMKHELAETVRKDNSRKD